MERINLTLRDEELWIAFRIACMQRHISASKAVECLIRAQLVRWQQDEACTDASEEPPAPARRPDA